MYHKCHAIKCQRQTKPSLLMCRKHWLLVPKSLQQEIWQAYRKGQEEDKKPSEQYMRVQLAAINYVATIEGHQQCDIDKRIGFLKERGHFN